MEGSEKGPPRVKSGPAETPLTTGLSAGSRTGSRSLINESTPASGSLPLSGGPLLGAAQAMLSEKDDMRSPAYTDLSGKKTPDTLDQSQSAAAHLSATKRSGQGTDTSVSQRRPNFQIPNLDVGAEHPSQVSSPSSPRASSQDFVLRRSRANEPLGLNFRKEGKQELILDSV
eukprot:Hpha_TRINITY_DN10865_c1_g1::TRINITY_DN10865_c1_g1_i1::g.23172::m.23172